jgi:hypothetical protein
MKKMNKIKIHTDCINTLKSNCYPFADEPNLTFVYLGEIKQMVGHCIIVGYETGRIFSGYHADTFQEIPEDDM